jgi:hypothetical protein
VRLVARAAVATVAVAYGGLVCVPPAAGQAAPTASADPMMSFFVTSVGLGDGADLGGIGGADYHCQQLAAAAGSTKTFYAYLSTRPANGTTTLDARDRIGVGPWYNARGALVARSVADLHEGNALTGAVALTEKGDPVSARDVLTGSMPDGTAYTDGMDHTCNVYTSNDRGSVQVGHVDRASDRSGGTSWNSAHATAGCSEAILADTGGRGLFYCFAID